MLVVHGQVSFIPDPIRSERRDDWICQSSDFTSPYGYRFHWQAYQNGDRGYDESSRKARNGWRGTSLIIKSVSGGSLEAGTKKPPMAE